MAHYSILIKGGVVIDGKGNPKRRADVGIELDKIKIVDDLPEGWGDIVIDATDRYVTPGFIDITNHSDTHWTLFNNPAQESLLKQGITTALGGSCGMSLAPLTRGNVIEGIQKWVDISQININWQTTAELLAELETKKFGVNFATLVGHGTLRRGISENEARPLSYEEIRKMSLLLEESLKEGAFGVSTNLGTSHEKWANDEEITEIFKVTKKYNALTKHHLADEGKNLLPSLSRLLGFSRSTETRTHISHLKAVGRTAWENFEKALFMIEQALKENIEISCDFFPYTKTGSNLYALLPGWAIEGGKRKILELFRDNKERKRIIAALKDMTLHYDRIIIASADRSPTSVGKTIQEISENSGLSPEEIFLDLLDVNELRVSIFNEAVLEKNIDILAKKEYAMIASDGAGHLSEEKNKEKSLPHPRSFGAFPKAFAWLIKEKGLMSWEEAVRKMTSFPAGVLGISGRGMVDVGAFADIAVINPETIQDKSDFANPFQLSAGIDWLLVNGQVAIENGVATGALSGRVLRRTD